MNVDDNITYLLILQSKTYNVYITDITDTYVRRMMNLETMSVRYCLL